MKQSKFTDLIKQYAHRYFIKAMGAMALGLFASLLIGTIFDTVATYANLPFLATVASYAKAATGMAIGVAIAHALGAHPLQRPARVFCLEICKARLRVPISDQKRQSKCLSH